jgi:hypothetical protein
VASKRRGYSRQRMQGRKLRTVPGQQDPPERHAHGTPGQDQPGPAPQPAQTTESNAGTEPAAHVEQRTES